MAAGYSGTPLAKKLGIKAGHAVALLKAPDGFEATLAGLPDGVTFRTAARGTNDVLVSFHTRRADVEQRLPALLAAMDVDDFVTLCCEKPAIHRFPASMGRRVWEAARIPSIVRSNEPAKPRNRS